MEITDKDIERFWSKVDIDLNYNSCWEWTGYRNNYGYGKFRLGGKATSTHRVAYMFERGDIPKGMHVLHRCDNPPCVNPNHLFTGTHQDNMRDKESKNRGNRPKGSTHGRAKLTESDIPVIRERLANDDSGASIARDYGVSQSAINRIKLGKTWGHVK